MKVKEPKNIVITKMPISVPGERAFKSRIADRILINAIVEYRKELEKKGVEIFERVDNIIATEEGYYFAFYEKDFEAAEEDAKMEPFKGEDGRMKVRLDNGKGEFEERDLAELVALTFIPNPNNYKYILFKDGDIANCSSDNIEWCEIEVTNIKKDEA